jgi:hypothetical protein
MGRPISHPSSLPRYESYARRSYRKMCDPCKHGSHSLCESERCPCVCNDSDVRWSRKAAASAEVMRLTSDPDLAQVLTVRPELRPLFGMPR